MVPNGFKDWAKPVGTGPFTLEKFDPGVRIVLKKRPDYWKEGRGWLDGADVTVINDGSARLNALISGQVDAINRVDHRAVALLSKTPKIEVVRAPGGWFTILAMQIDKEPYSNPDIRLALKYATNREEILKAMFSGYGTLGNDHPIPRSDPYFNSELPQRKYDPEKAAFHLKKSGIADPKILLQASDAAFNGAVDMATLFQANAEKAGIKVDVKKEPADGFFDNVWLKDAFVESYWGGRPAATQMLAVAFAAECAVERDALEERQVREAALRRARGDRRSQAQGLYLGDAGHAQRRRRRAHSGFPRLAGRPQQQGRRPYAPWRLRHGQRHDSR